MMKSIRSKPLWLLGLAVVVASCAVLQQIGCGVAEESRSVARKNGNGNGNGKASTSDAFGTRPRVVVVKPHKGGLGHSTTQPVTMESFDFADLYAKISGYIQVQPVDIGDRVTKGQVLAEIDAPEFNEELKEAEAAVVQAQAVVEQMKARVTTAKAEHEAAIANIDLAQADVAKTKSYLKFREIQFQRISDLFEKKSIEERLVDEKHEQRDAAEAAANSAVASVAAARAQVVAAHARIISAEADVRDADAKVQLAQAKVAKARVFVDYEKIISPYEGVITRRSFHVGEFIRAADQGGNTPLLTVARTDKMRVIMLVPERDVPYTNVDDPAVVSVDILAGEKFTGKVSRIANSEDRVTKTMRTEIDLPNPKNRLRDGMFGRATIQLDDGKQGSTVPSSSVFTDSKTRKPSIFVVVDGKLHQKTVETSQDDGSRIEILSGLSPDDEVVRRPSADLKDGALVETEKESDTVASSSGGSR